MSGELTVRRAKKLPHPQLQRSVVMVEKDLAKISTVRKMVLEHDLATERNVATEVVPFLQAETKRLLESLCSSIIVNRGQPARGQ
jgi:hypothetical protein